MRVRGKLEPYTAGAQVTVSLFRKSRRVQRKVVTVKPSGRFAVSVKPSKRGAHRVRVSQGTVSDSARLQVVRPRAQRAAPAARRSGPCSAG